MTAALGVEQAAKEAADAIFGDIAGRKGVGDELDGIDEDIQTEMREEWQRIIVTALSALASPPGAPVALEYRYKEIHPQTVNYGEWGDWTRCNAEKFEEIREYIKRGYTYETRTLYASPTSPPAQEGKDDEERTWVHGHGESDSGPEHYTAFVAPSEKERERLGETFQRLCVDAGRSIEHVGDLHAFVDEHWREIRDALRGPLLCTRSHPHENMDAICERFTQYERDLAALRQADAPVGWASVPVGLTVRMAAVFEGVDLSGSDEDDYKHLVAKWKPEWAQLLAAAPRPAGSEG